MLNLKYNFLYIKITIIIIKLRKDTGEKNSELFLTISTDNLLSQQRINNDQSSSFF